MAPERPLARVRWLIAGVVITLAVLALLFLRGPDFWQRWYYPLPEEYRGLIAESARRHQVNPYLVAAVIDAESDWRPDTVSDAGAVGLMQVLPETAEELSRRGVVSAEYDPTELASPAVGIEYGTAYLRLLVERYHEIEPAVAAYNAGMGNVDQWVAAGGDIRDHIEFPETRHFVLRVARARDVYERLYPGALDTEE